MFPCPDGKKFTLFFENAQAQIRENGSAYVGQNY
jgi:hypothetical protein